MLRVTQLSGFGIGSGAVTIGRVLAASGSYAVVGNTAGVTKFSPANKILTAAASSYSLTGTAASLTKTTGMTAAAAAFLARTTGLDTTHTNAYIALIDGLVADGIWSKLDVLHIYATQDAATALLNLVSTSYDGSYIGTAPTFTADRGFTGSDGTNNSQTITTNFNPVTASSPQNVQNSAHISCWSLTNMTSTMMIMGANHASGWVSGIYAKYTDNNCYMYSNTTTNAITVTSIANSVGHYISNRSNSTDRQGYKNGSSVATTTSDASVAPVSYSINTVGYYINSVGNRSSGNQIAMASIGSSLNSTDAANFYNRLRTYMTAVGVP